MIGPSGAGKSTLAHVLAQRLGGTRLDLDELFHGPDWAPTPTPQFRLRVAAALDDAGERWVIAGNYTMVADITHGAADTIVWLDLPRRRTVARVIRRSIRRVARREQLWNGNRERVRNLLSRDPDRNIIVAAWQTHPLVRHQYEALTGGPMWAHATVHRLRTPGEVRRFVDSVAP